MTVYGGSILLYYNLCRQTSKGPSEHLLKELRETGEKPRSTMGAKSTDRVHINIHLYYILKYFSDSGCHSNNANNYCIAMSEQSAINSMSEAMSQIQMTNERD